MRACDPLTACTDTPGTWECSRCPDGYRGSGRTGCRKATACAVNNGGCWVSDDGRVRQQCTDRQDAIGDCGACPADYNQTEVGCEPVQGCIAVR